MTSKREQILEALKSQIAVALSAMGVSVTRSLTDAYEVDDADVIVVHRGVNNISEDMLSVADHTMQVMVSVVTRSAVPDRQADTYFVPIHPLVLHFSDLDIIDVSAGKTDEPKYGGSDGRVAMVTSHFFIQYRTDANSIEA